MSKISNLEKFFDFKRNNADFVHINGLRPLGETIGDVLDKLKKLRTDVNKNRKDIDQNTNDIKDLKDDVVKNTDDIKDLQDDISKIDVNVNVKQGKKTIHSSFFTKDDTNDSYTYTDSGKDLIISGTLFNDNLINTDTMVFKDGTTGLVNGFVIKKDEQPYLFDFFNGSNKFYYQHYKITDGQSEPLILVHEINIVKLSSSEVGFVFDDIASSANENGITITKVLGAY